MPVCKRILCPARLRKVPPQFNWIDHRLVRDKYISRVSVQALALYLFLVTVADADGLSYYSDNSIARLLPLSAEALPQIRRELVAAHLIAYQRPLYQVLALDVPAGVPQRNNKPVAIGQLLNGLEAAT